MKCLWCHAETGELLNWSFLFSKSKIDNQILCRQCQGLLSPIGDAKKCPGCSRINKTEEFCSDCLAWKQQYPKEWIEHSALFKYDDFAKEFMNRFKYQGDTQLANILKSALRKFLAPLEKEWLFTPIPSSQKSLKERGFNQIECILQMSGLSYEIILESIAQGQNQAEKNRRERLASPQSFQLLKDKKKWIQDKKIYIIDDVYTTGRTLYHAKVALQYAKEVKSLSIFR